MDRTEVRVPDPLVGRQIREYLILEKIGEGGMGAVYKAYHEIQRQYRALKVLKKEFMEDESFVRRFYGESRILEEVIDRHIARFFESFRFEGRLFIAMEFVEGERLDHRLNGKGPLSEKELVPIFRQICSGLQAAHSHNVVHRDLSPDNLVLVQSEKEERVKILDFGIAKRIDDQDVSQIISSEIGVFMGKVRYCAPEQLQLIGQGSHDPRIDIYSLGVIMYEMLTGRLPFEASDLETFIEKKTNEPPVPLRENLPTAVNCSLELERLIIQMLETDRGRRPQTVRQVLEKLDRIGRPAKPPWPKRHWKTIVGVTVLTVCILVWRTICLHNPGSWLCLPLHERTADIYVSSLPSGASVFLNGTLHSEATPCEIDDVKHGRTLVEVKKNGYEDWSQEVALQKGQHLSLVDIVLSPQMER